MNWHLQDAKNSLSKLVKMAENDGPQVITLRGERAAVVIAARDYDRLIMARPTLVDSLLATASWDDQMVEDANQRSKLPGRMVEF